MMAGKGVAERRSVNVASTKEKPAQRVAILRYSLSAAGAARLIITSFVLLLFVLAAIMKMGPDHPYRHSLMRIGMNGVLASRCAYDCMWVGLNSGARWICGIMGAVSMNWNLQVCRVFLGDLDRSPIAMVAGYIYALILERFRTK